MNSKLGSSFCEILINKEILKFVGKERRMDYFAIETKNITKIYDEQICVSNLNMHVRGGKIYGLLGRNGAGKTTTMKMLLNLIEPTRGKILFCGKSLHENVEKILPHVGSMIESPGFYPNLTGTENLKIFARLRKIRNIEAIKSALELVGLSFEDKKLYSQYSLGMKQRLAIALAIMHNPDILILDEPTNGLDPIGIAEVREFLIRLCQENGKTILISSHILSEIAMLADDIGIIEHGVLLEEGTIKDLEKKSNKHILFKVSNPEYVSKLLSRYFDISSCEVKTTGEIIIPWSNLSMPDIIRMLVQEGIDIYEASICEETLEDYFKRITGGKGIG